MYNKLTKLAGDLDRLWATKESRELYDIISEASDCESHAWDGKEPSTYDERPEDYEGEGFTGMRDGTPEERLLNLIAGSEEMAKRLGLSHFEADMTAKELEDSLRQVLNLEGLSKAEMDSVLSLAADLLSSPPKMLAGTPRVRIKEEPEEERPRYNPNKPWDAFFTPAKEDEALDVIANNLILKELIKLANNLDAKGFQKEADVLDNIIKKATPFDVARYGIAGAASSLFGSPESSPLDDVDDQEEAAKRREKVKEVKENQKKLEKTMSWVSENLYYSSQDGSSKFPIEANRELKFYAEGIVAAGTRFDSLDHKVQVRDYLGRPKEPKTLRHLIQRLEKAIEKHKEWLSKNQ